MTKQDLNENDHLNIKDNKSKSDKQKINKS